MSATTTRAPSSTNLRAVAAPIPDAAPVTIATLPSRRPIESSLSRPAAACKGARVEFGLFYEIPVAAPWTARSERDAYHRVIEQAVLGEAVGFSHFWTVEHHFLSEFSHCSAPEALYGAVAAPTRTLPHRHPARPLPLPDN